MKKRILAILIYGLLLLCVTACNVVPENEIDATENANKQMTTVPSTDGCKENDNPSHTLMLVDFETYDSIISVYRRIVELCPRHAEVSENDYITFANAVSHDLYEQLFVSTLLLYPQDNNRLDGNCYERFGYTVRDLNGDGVDELILRMDDHQVVAVFTTVKGSPVMVEHFGNRKNCWIDPDGYLHVGGSSGADKSTTQIYRISDQTGELILLEEGGTDGHDETNGVTLFYKLVNNEKIHITQEEYKDWFQNLPYAKFEVTESISEYMPFIPLFDDDHPVPKPYVQQAEG